MLTRPAETRQHDQFYLLPPPRPRGGPPAPLPHPCPLWLTRPAETRQPPYLPSPPPPPPSCWAMPSTRRGSGPPWRSSAPRHALLSPLGFAWSPVPSLPRPASCLAPASSLRGEPLPPLPAPLRALVVHYTIGSVRCLLMASRSCAPAGIGPTLSASFCMPAFRSWSLPRLGGRCPLPPSRLTLSFSPGPRRPGRFPRLYVPFSTPYA